MAKSNFEYVKSFETDDKLLENTWIVVRIDGKGFHKFSDTHQFTKPNDKTALDLMNKCARQVMKDFNEIILAYGQSDEYSFVFRRDAMIYGRRGAKIVTNICSLFASSYVFFWRDFFPDKKLEYPPCFDGRAVLYPSEKNIRDYLSWRQADCHINNLYNTVFWALVLKGGMTPREAQERLKGTVSGDKNEILFSQFNINYNKQPEQFRKGSTLIKKKVQVPVDDSSKSRPEVDGQKEKDGAADGKNETPGGKNRTSATVKLRTQMMEFTCDIIGNDFWQQNPHLLEPYREL